MSKDYEVGYGKPPKAHQFKPNYSGNPAGRKAGSRGLKTDLMAELDARHSMRIGKKEVTDTRQRLMVRTLAIRAASGELKATQVMVPMILHVLGIEDRGNAKERLSAADEALLAHALAYLTSGELSEIGDDDGHDTLPIEPD